MQSGAQFVFILLQSNFGQTTNLSLNKSFQCCLSTLMKDHPEGLVFLFFPFSFLFQLKKRRIRNGKMKNWMCQSSAISVSTYGGRYYFIGCCWKLIWTVKRGTHVPVGCIHHITFSPSVLSTDTWHRFSNISPWANSTVNAIVATPTHTHHSR